MGVPVCPLCNQPIPVSRGSVPDMVVSDHIENNCQVRRKEKVFSNRCNKPKCKKKELVPCICDICKLLDPPSHLPLIVLVNLKLPTSSLVPSDSRNKQQQQLVPAAVEVRCPQQLQLPSTDKLG